MDQTAAGAKKKWGVVRPRTLRQETADVLRDAIFLGKLEPGQRLVEGSLARELGVGRVPVREAIHQLEQQGLVTIVPNLGARVAKGNIQEGYEVLILRMYLEILAARLAATRQDQDSFEAMGVIVSRMAALSASEENDLTRVRQELLLLDREFHQHLIEASGSSVFKQIWSMVGMYMWVIGRSALQELQGDFPGNQIKDEFIRLVVDQHRHLLDAILTGDMDLAEEAVRIHMADVIWKAGLDASVLKALHWPLDNPQP